MKNQYAVFALVLMAGSVNAQLLSTAETWGKGKSAVSVNGSFFTCAGSPTTTFEYASYMRGVTDRLDLVVTAGEFTVPGRGQAQLAGGFNLNLVKTARFSLATYHVVGTALQSRRDSSDAWWYPTLVANTNLKLGKQLLSPYVGYAVTVPIGHVNDKTFTWADPIHNVPMGVAVPKGRWVFMAEYDYGRKVKAAAFSVAFLLQKTE